MYLLLALKQVHCDRLHFLLLVLGFVFPFFLVFSSFGVSVYLGAEIYVRTYTADGLLVPNSNSVASFANLTEICWLRPEFLLELELIPVAVILSFNLTVLLFAVFLAFKSATYRCFNSSNVSTQPKNLSGMSHCPSSWSKPSGTA